MSEKTWERNTAGLVAHAHQRKEEKRKRVEEVITRLLREHQAVNFNTVAKAAGVSKAYLYTQPLFRDRIEAQRAAHQRTGRGKPQAQAATQSCFGQSIRPALRVLSLFPRVFQRRTIMGFSLCLF